MLTSLFLLLLHFGVKHDNIEDDGKEVERSEIRLWWRKS